VIREKKVTETAAADSPFLQSINIGYDAEHPERLVHFQPTGKCVHLITRLAGELPERAYFVVAPYGTGKSLTSAYLLHLVENRPSSHELLESIAPRLRRVSPVLADFASDRIRNRKRRGVVVVLEGAVRDLGEALQSAVVAALRRCRLGRQARTIANLTPSGGAGAATVLRKLSEKATAVGLDRIVLIWDEFGRHLEYLASTGRAAELADVQQLAEYAARARTVPVTLGLLMHQQLLTYAGDLPDSALAEWRKVEGRFTALQYTDDSVELYELLSTIISKLRKTEPPRSGWLRKAGSLQAHGLFSEIPARALAALLRSGWPLDPVTLYLLPRLAARAAQNERTVFSFLFSADLSRKVDPNTLYEYFGPVMEADRGIGGTYRVWLETESACAKCNDELEVAVLRLTSLLGLGLSGTSLRLTSGLLTTAAELTFGGGQKVTLAIEALLERRLLLHRRHVDEISLWHGTNVDLRARLEESRAESAASIDVVEFLSKERPPPVWKPVAYNDEFSIRRFYTSRYVAAELLSRTLAEFRLQGGMQPDSDGEIWYILARSVAAQTDALTTARTFQEEARLLFAVVLIPPGLTEVIGDILGLRHLQMDEALHAEDPLIATELGHFIDDAVAHLDRLVEGMMAPGRKGPTWVHGGRLIDVRSASHLRHVLSNITRANFYGTPRINNEMIVRRRPSGVVINARKKLCLGILERCGQERLGIEGDFADAALFRAVLLNTGLYRMDPARGWRFADPDELDDEHAKLREVWRQFRALVSEPSDRAKNLGAFFEELQRPPIGLRAGVIPILLAAAFVAFPSARSIARQDGDYVTDLLPSEVESMCREPARYRLLIPKLRPPVAAYLKEVARVFASEGDAPTDTDFVRAAHDALVAWYAGLPNCAKTSRHVSRRARRLQRALARFGDPLRLFLRELPRIMGVGEDAYDLVIHELVEVKAELEQVLDFYREQVAAVMIRTLAAGGQSQGRSLRAAIAGWSVDVRTALTAGVSNAQARALAQALSLSYDTDARAIERIAATCDDRPLSGWDDERLATFETRFPRLVEQIEYAVLPHHDPGALLRRRIDRAVRALAHTTGPHDTVAFLYELANYLQPADEVHDADRPRRTRSA